MAIKPTTTAPASGPAVVFCQKINNDLACDLVVIELPNGCTICDAAGLPVALPYKSAKLLTGSPELLAEFAAGYTEANVSQAALADAVVHTGPLPGQSGGRRSAAARSAEGKA